MKVKIFGLEKSTHCVVLINVGFEIDGRKKYDTIGEGVSDGEELILDVDNFYLGEKVIVRANFD